MCFDICKVLYVHILLLCTAVDTVTIDTQQCNPVLLLRIVTMYNIYIGVWLSYGEKGVRILRLWTRLVL